jgi:hypothetical protein
MAIIRPPVTGDMSLDSWMDEVTKRVTLASQTADAVATAQALTSGVNPVNAVTLVLYKRYTSNTLPASEEILVETVYEYSTTVLTNSETESTTDFSGWSRSIPDISNGDYLFACQVNIADTAPIEIIAATDWSSPVLIASANTEGLDGFNSATVTLYQRTSTATAPSDPLGTLTYNFAAGGYTRTVTNDGWVDINNLGSGSYLWIATASAISRSSTYNITDTEWTVTGLSVDGVDGVDGTNGRSSAVLLIYKRATVAPTAPSGGSFNFGTSELTPPAEWSTSIPTGDDPVYVSQAIASIIGQNGIDSSIAWDIPKLAFQNGNDGQDGQDGTEGKSLFEGFIFKRSATEPEAPVGGQFDFTNNILTPPPGWFLDIPTGDDPAWLSTGLFSIIGDTGIDNTVTWTTPTKSFDNGLDGVDGTDGLSVYQFNVFRRDTTTPTAPTGGSYDFTNNTATAPTGWSTEIPSGSDPLYVSTTTASVSGPTGTDSTLTWTSPVELVRNGIDGVDGTDGRSTALLSIYRRASSEPEVPTGGSFNFSTSLLTPPSGWSTSIPTGTDPVYVVQATASVIGNTGIDSTLSWGDVIELVRNGDDGLSSKSYFEGFIFKRSATNPDTPTGGEFNFGDNVLTPPSGWSVDIPSGSDPAWMAQGLFEVVGDTGIDNTVTWSIPTKSFENGLDGQPGTDGNSVFQFSIYKRSSSPITTPPSGGSYDFGTNTATAPTGWYTYIPDGTAPCYVSTTIASVNGPTGIDLTLAWNTPTKLVQDGANGTDGADGTNGTDGTDGNPAPRYSTFRVWYEGGGSVPGSPSGTITWSTGSISNLTQDWSLTAPTVNANGSTVAWFSDIVFSDTTGTATNSSAIGGTPQRAINFDGIVTFTNSNTISDGTNSTAFGALASANSVNLSTQVSGVLSETNASDTLKNSNVTKSTVGANSVYRQDGVPTSGVIVGDIWIDTNDNNKVYVAASNGANQVIAGEWELAQDSASAASAASSAQATANTANTAASNAQTTANSKNSVFRQTGAPSANKVGDIWIDTDDGNKVYIATGTGTGNWVVETGINNTSISLSSGGQLSVGSTNLGSVTYSGLGSVPTAQLDGVVTAINTGTTTINGSKITTGTIAANRIDAASGTFNTANIPNLNADKITAGTINVDRIAANSIDTNKISVGGVQTGNIATNAVTAIAKVSGTSGNVTGVQGDNTIEATVAEVTITTTGGPITILGQSRFSGLSAYSNAQFKLLRGTTYITSGGSVTYPSYSNTLNTLVYDDNVAAGTYTYKLVINTNFNSGTIYWNNGYLQVTETKR